MARKPSVILTPTEKKAAVGAAKDAVKASRARVTELEKGRKSLDAEHKKTIKKVVGDYDSAVKAFNKDIAAANKLVVAAENELLKLNPPAPPKAEPSPVGV